MADSLARALPKVFLCVALGALGSARAAAQCDVVRIVAPDGAAQWIPAGIGRTIPGFGATVEADGERVAIGNPRDGGRVGAVYVFVRSGLNWFLEAKLVPSDPLGDLYFGIGLSGGTEDGLEGGVDLAGDVLVVGTIHGHEVLGRPREPAHGSRIGAAYVFEREGTRWRETARLSGEFWPRRAPFTAFGSSVATDGKTILVASQWGSTVQGPAVYVFEKRAALDGSERWTEVAQLPWPDQELVHVAGDWAAAGSALYARVDGTWIPYDTLPGRSERFEDERLLVSDAAGIVVLAEASGAWSEVDSYPDPAAIGVSSWVARSDRWTVLGAPTCRWNQPGESGGSVTLLERSGKSWNGTTWRAFDGHPCDRYGKEVELAGDLAFVAAPAEEDAEGAVYVISLTGAECATLTYEMRAHEPWDDATIRRPHGGQQILTLDAGAEHAGRPYLLAGSRAGTSPGLALGRWRIPLNPDPYFRLLLGHANRSVFPNNLGVLDGEGRATVTFELPPGYDPALAGLFHHAFVVFAPGRGLAHVSNAASVRVLAGLHH